MFIRKGRPIFLGVLAVLLFAVPMAPYLYFGVMRKEHFHRCRPTSYWSKEVQAWWESHGGSDGWSKPWLDCAIDRFTDRRGVSTPAILCGDPEATPVLLDLLQASNGHVRLEAAVALCEAGIRSKGAVPTVIHLLGHEDAGIRIQAALFLGVIAKRDQVMGKTDHAVTEALREALKDDNVEVRMFAARALALEASESGERQKGTR